MVFDDGEDATLQLSSEDDDEDAHAGLDLPTSVIQAVMAGEGVSDDFEIKELPQDDTETKQERKKKILIALIVVLVPSIFMLGMHFAAKSKISAINVRYEDASKAAGIVRRAAELKPHIDDLFAIAEAYEEFAATHPLAPAASKKAEAQAFICNALAKNYERKHKARVKRMKREEEEKRERETREKELVGVRAEVEKALAELRADRAEEDASSLHWKKHAKKAFETLERFKEDRERFPQVLGDMFEEVKIPIKVASDPGSAKIYLNQNRKPEAEMTEPAGSGVVWVKPFDLFTLRIVKDGFTEFRSKEMDASQYHEFYEELKRKQMRTALRYGWLTLEFGANNAKRIPMLPAHAPTVVSDDQLFFVDQSGLLRSFLLSGKGKQNWPNCPGGPNCGVPDNHVVGHFGDPVPGIHVAEGVILVPSLDGHISAHGRSKGDRIWSVNLNSPVTSPPAYAGVVAVGTADGRVVFISSAGRETWKFQTENAVISAPYVVGNLCLVGSTDNRVYLLDWKAKRRLGRPLQFSSDVVLGPIPMGRRYLVGTASGQVHVIKVDASGSSKRLRKAKGRNGRVISFGKPSRQRRPVVGMVVAQINGRRVLFYSVGRNLVAVDVDNPTAEVWKKPFYSPGGRVTAPTLHPDETIIYVGGGRSGLLFAIDTRTGKDLWRFATPRDDKNSRSPITTAPFIRGDELLVPSRDSIYILKPE
jgi:outer membrane protein assembly factor BamB